jgi:hypothetical protein
MTDPFTSAAQGTRQLAAETMAEGAAAIATAVPLRVLAVDPGYQRSAWCLYWTDHVVELETRENAAALNRIGSGGFDAGTTLAVEMVESYGMPVGREVFRTVLWTGRFIEAWRGGAVVLVPRRVVKLELCRSSRAKDSNVAQAVRDILGEPPKKGHPTAGYGTRRPVADQWAAIAVALTYQRLAAENRLGELETLEG